MKFTRRQTLSALSVVATVPVATSAQSPSGQTQIQGAPRFDHGVASGDPLHDGIILWTRVSGTQSAVKVNWQMALDETFSDVIASGEAATGPERDFTVKVDVRGLKAGTLYVYRFDAGGVTSPVGRTCTLPEDLDEAVLAVASCSLHPNGYFHAYREIANMERVDAVVHLGDYIYEYGAEDGAYGMKGGRLLNRIPEPPHEIVTLSDYRMRHAQYKREPELQAAHARAPFICVYDDHESANNAWMDGAENHTEGKEGQWATRKAASLAAYAEWMPIREAEPGRLSEGVYRSFRYGTLFELFMLDTRLIGRDEQLEYGKDLTIRLGRWGKPVPDVDKFLTKLHDPSRDLLGEAQARWLSEGLKASVEAGVHWQILGSQVIMTRANGPDFYALLPEDQIKTILAGIPSQYRDLVKKMGLLFGQGKPLPFNLDAWDGYPAARERLYDIIKATKARVVVVSGDSHCAWANQLHDVDGQRVAAEFGVTAISSPTSLIDPPVEGFNLYDLITAQNAEIIAANDRHNGFISLSVSAGSISADWVAISSVRTPDYDAFVDKSFVVEAHPQGVGPVTIV